LPFNKALYLHTMEDIVPVGVPQFGSAFKSQL